MIVYNMYSMCTVHVCILVVLSLSAVNIYMLYTCVHMRTMMHAVSRCTYTPSSPEVPIFTAFVEHVLSVICRTCLLRKETI